MCCSYIPNYVWARLTAPSVHSKDCPSLSVCVSYILKSVFCTSMHEVSRTRCPGSGGSEEVRLRDGICGARDLVYFPPWIPVLPAGFSQVLASIRLGSWVERRGIKGFRRGEEGWGWRREGQQSWSLSHTTQHSWRVGKTGGKQGEIENDRS